MPRVKSGGEISPAAIPPAGFVLAGTRSASGIELDRLRDHLVARLDAAGFFFPPHKRASMIFHLENPLHRAPLTEADVRTIHVVVRALAVKAGGRK